MEDCKMPVPYVVYESTAARFERTVKRLIMSLVISIIMLCISNLAWLYVWNSYDYESTQVMVDSENEGNANYIGNSGVINNGEGHSQ